jgi:hypothetical protein
LSIFFLLIGHLSKIIWPWILSHGGEQIGVMQPWIRSEGSPPEGRAPQRLLPRATFALLIHVPFILWFSHFATAAHCQHVYHNRTIIDHRRSLKKEILMELIMHIKNLKIQEHHKVLG